MRAWRTVRERMYGGAAHRHNHVPVYRCAGQHPALGAACRLDGAGHRRQEAILREAIAARGGWAFKQIGDSFQAAFQTASTALDAAVAAQQCARLLQDALAQAQELGHKATTADCLYNWAELVATAGQFERAVRLFGAVAAIYAAGGQIEAPLDQAASDKTMAALQAQLGEAVWHQAWQEGHAMTLGAAIGYALSKEPPSD